MSLDLSNNRLTYLPSNFTVLTSLTKLDLSKNEITELPEEFGTLSKLRYLDLYKNKLERLPLSFNQLIHLKFLDLKDNPLVPVLAKVAGPCVDTKGCQQCARDIVNFYKKLQEEVDTEVEMRNKARAKQLELNKQKKQDERKKNKVEKQKNKKNNVEKEIKNNLTEKPPKKEPKKNKNVQKRKHKDRSSSFSYLFLFIFFLLLWVLISIEHPVLQPLSNTISKYFNTTVNKLPIEYKSYGEFCGSAVKSSQEHTKRFVQNTVEFIHTNLFSQDIVNKIKETYFKLSQKIAGK